MLLFIAQRHMYCRGSLAWRFMYS